MNAEFIARFKLKPLELSDKSILTPFTAQISQPLTEHSFASWFIWGKPLSMHWSIYKNHLCLFVGGDNELTLFVPPLRSAEALAADFPDVIRYAFEVMDAWNLAHHGRKTSVIEYVSEQFREHFQTLQDSLELVQTGTDYVYDMQKMIELPGSSLKSKRHAKTKFMRDFPEHTARLYDDSHKQDCTALLSTWGNHRNSCDGTGVSRSNTSLSKLVSRDYDAVVLALNHWQELGLTGMVCYFGSRLIGFTFGEALSPTQASILIEKTDPEYPGCPQFIFSEFCKAAWNSFPECNAGDDWGIPNLSFTKMSYRPIKLLPKYSVRYK
jgi:hypothetical protein